MIDNYHFHDKDDKDDKRAIDMRRAMKHALLAAAAERPLTGII